MNPESFQSRPMQVPADGESAAAEKHLRASASEEGNAHAPKVTVIVPVYKAEKYLPECIESVLAQTFTDFELILVDDGSPDNSGKICDEYAARDSRIRVFHNPNGGVTSARNHGVKRSRGEWIMFVDSDDKLFSHALRELTEALGNFPDADLVEAMVSRDENPPHPTDPENQNIVCATGRDYAVGAASHKKPWSPGPVAKIMRKRAVISAMALDVPAWINFGEDTMMNIRLARRVREAVHVPATIYFYRRNPEGACAAIRPTARYYANWLQELERSIPGGLDGDWADVWRAAARVFFIAMFLVCDDWIPNDPYMRKIVRELSRRSRAYSIGTRLCLIAAQLPSLLQHPARAFLAGLLSAKVKTFKR